jgi:hypothetical protein
MLFRAFAALLLFAAMAAAQITGLCNTGQTRATASGCTGVLVTPNPTSGGPNRDGNWALATPYPSPYGESPCEFRSFVPAWVDTPNGAWVPNSASTASEWITPYDGAERGTQGWYVYATKFPVPSVLPGGIVPTGLTINGQLTSDNSTYALYMANLAADLCARVTGLPAPLNPVGFTEWTDFSFSNPIPISPGSPLVLYVVVQNAPGPEINPTGLRIEFFDTSAFN